jgi:hypothetical protein
MACPEEHTLDGDMTAMTSFYPTEAEAASGFHDLAVRVADQLAVVSNARFRCPDGDGCFAKRIGAVTVSNERFTFSPDLGMGFAASGSFAWSAIVTCDRHRNPQVGKLAKAFRNAVKEHAKANHTVASGYTNDFLVSVSWLLSTIDFGLTEKLGEGCTAWSEWVRSWFWSGGWEGVTITHLELPFPFTHKIQLVTFPDGTRLILDPWRDPDNPIWDADDYNELYGPWIMFD